MKKRIFYFGIIFIFSILIINAALDVSFKLTNKWESSDRILGNIDGFDKTLQEAIDEGLLISDGQVSATIAGLPLTPQSVGHSFDEIWISVNGGEMSLQEAIETKGLSGDLNFDGNYLNAPDPSHLATEIEISEGKSLQDSINNNEIIYTSKYYSQCFMETGNSGEEIHYRYWYDSNDRREDVREGCGENNSIPGEAEYYCGGDTNIYYKDIYLDYRDLGCSNDACYTNPNRPNWESNCGGTRSERIGICSEGDCYGLWTYPTAITTTSCTSSVLPVDTCNGDRANPYTCGIYENGGTTGCIDINYDSGDCVAKNFAYFDGYYIFFYDLRTVYCYSTKSVYIAPPGPVLPPGGGPTPVPA